jgi:hypothetical protein
MGTRDMRYSNQRRLRALRILAGFSFASFGREAGTTVMRGDALSLALMMHLLQSIRKCGLR